MKKDYGVVPGFTRPALCHGIVVEAALQALYRDTSSADETIKALRAVKLDDTPRGPLHFDDYGNVVGNIFIRRIEKAGNGLTNLTLKTYENVSQFWPYEAQHYLKQPVYTQSVAGRDWVSAHPPKLPRGQEKSRACDILELISLDA
jgi:branched-chain amino acid transport system substrate-binding protein